MTLSRPTAFTGFALSTAAVYAASAYVTTRLAESPEVLAVALTLDLTVLVPLLFYGLLVRGRGWPPASVGLAFLVSLGAAAPVIPEGHRAPLRVMQSLAVVVELGLTGYVLVRAARAVRRAKSEAAEGDVVAWLRAGFRERLGVGWVADAAAYEVAVLYYALMG